MSMFRFLCLVGALVALGCCAGLDVLAVVGHVNAGRPVTGRRLGRCAVVVMSFVAAATAIIVWGVTR